MVFVVPTDLSEADCDAGFHVHLHNRVMDHVAKNCPHQNLVGSFLPRCLLVDTGFRGPEVSWKFTLSLIVEYV